MEGHGAREGGGYDPGCRHPIGYDLVTWPHTTAREAVKHSQVESQEGGGSMAFPGADSSTSHVILSPFARD